MHPCTWTIATPSDRMRIQSAAPGRKRPSSTGPTKGASSKCQMIRRPSDTTPTTSLRSLIVAPPRNFGSHRQRPPSGDLSPARGGAGRGRDRRRALTDLIPGRLFRLEETGGDRLAGETKHRQELDQPNRLARNDRAKDPRVGLAEARLEHPDGFADGASVDPILDRDAVTRPHRRDSRQDGRSNAGSDDRRRPGRIGAPPQERRSVSRLAP